MRGEERYEEGWTDKFDICSMTLRICAIRGNSLGAAGTVMQIKYEEKREGKCPAAGSSLHDVTPRQPAYVHVLAFVPLIVNEQ